MSDVRMTYDENYREEQIENPILTNGLCVVQGKIFEHDHVVVIFYDLDGGQYSFPLPMNVAHALQFAIGDLMARMPQKEGVQ